MPSQSNITPIQVIIITTANGLQQKWIDELEAQPGINIVARVGVRQQGIEAVGQQQPDIVVIDRAVDEIEEALHGIFAVTSNTLCVGVIEDQNMATVRRLVAAGARDILIKPIEGEDVATSLRSVVELEKSRRERAGLPTLASARQAPAPGKVVVVMAPKGGVGATTVATNLAVALRQVTGQNVALADFSLQFGDVAVLLNLWSKHTLHDLAIHYQAIDDTLLDRVLVEHPSGLKVLQAPGEPDMMADVSGAQVAAIVGALRSRFGFVAVDCWSFVDEVTETLAASADQVLLVTTPEVPALKNTKQAIEYFVRHGVARDNIALVLNRFPSVKGITLQDIQEHLRHPIQANLPSDGPAVTFAANKGIPVIQSHPQSWVAQSFLRLAAWIAGDQVNTISEGAAPSSAANGGRQQGKRRFSLRRS